MSYRDELIAIIERKAEDIEFHTRRIREITNAGSAFCADDMRHHLDQLREADIAKQMMELALMLFDRDTNAAGLGGNYNA